MENKHIAMMEDVYRFVMLASDEYAKPHDYGTGKVLNMVEMHTLAMIAENPGICITDVAKLWNRTLGAASRNVQRLCDKGYAEKRKLPGNEKTIHLYPTELGLELARRHREYDRENVEKTVSRLLAHHSEEELVNAYQILLTAIRIYEEKGNSK